MRHFPRYLMLSILAMALMGLVGCSEDITTPDHGLSAGNPVAKNAEPIQLDGATRYEGVMGGENIYVFVVPDDWNGELVLYSHGFVDAGEPIQEPDKDNVAEIRDRIVGMGFAWAYGSYRENGMAVKDGAWATRQLVGKFQATVKQQPAYTWLMGNSLGALVAIELAETHPAEFDGIVTLNGMVGGTKAQLDYVGNIRLLFDLFYPGVLPGSVCDVPEDFDLTYDVIYPVVGAVQADPTGLGVISRLKNPRLPGRDGEELVEALVTAIGFNFRGLHDVLDRTGGDCPIDNADTVYEPVLPGYLPDDVLWYINNMIPRYDRSVPKEGLFDRYYEPTGDLRIPMVAVHHEHDPVVPLFEEHLYAAKVAAMGCSQNHELRVVPRFAHTDFPADEAAEEAAQALMDLRLKALAGGAVLTR